MDSMAFGAVLPHNEIGTDPGAMIAYAQGVEALGATHLLIYDHVLGADPDRPGGLPKGAPYDKDVAFHEPLTTLAFIAGVTQTLGLMSTVLILPQRQTALVAKQAAQVAILSNNRLRLGIGTGWNQVEYTALNENFKTRGARQADQVELMRELWTHDTLDYKTDYHHIDKASINPRPSAPVPIWFGGAAPALLKRCGELGDGWVPLMGANDNARKCLEQIAQHRAAVGKTMEGFGIQAQAQYAGGTPERWSSHAAKWRAMGATHLALATHNAGPTDVDGHLARFAEYLAVVKA